MNRSEKNDLMQNALQGRLTPGEKRRWEEWLASDPDLRAEFEEEKALEQALDALPPAPVASNFTARVVQEAQREIRGRAPGARPSWFWRWRPALATGFAAIALGGVVYQQQRQAAREELAESLTQFTEVTSTLAAAAAPPLPEIIEPPLPPVLMLQDFQAIQHLAHMPAEQEQDLELYLALHK